MKSITIPLDVASFIHRFIATTTIGETIRRQMSDSEVKRLHTILEDLQSNIAKEAAK